MDFFTFDKDYLDRLRKGDASTERHFVAYFEQLLHIKLRTKAQPSHMLDDLRQETFARVMAALHQEGEVRQPQQFTAFVNSICNDALLHYRRFQTNNQPVEDVHMNIEDEASDLGGDFITKQSAERLRHVLSEMPKRDRDLLRAIFLEEKEKDDVCKEFGVDRDYLRVLLRRAKDSFRVQYAKHIPASRQVPGTEHVPVTEQIPAAKQVSSAGQTLSVEQTPAAKREPPNPTTPPGAMLYSIAEFICSKRTMEQVVIPLLADMQFEHNEAFSAGRKLEATWVRVHGCWSLFTALGINRVVRFCVRIFLRLSSR